MIELKFSNWGCLDRLRCFRDSLLLDEKGLWLIFEDDILVSLRIDNSQEEEESYDKVEFH